MQQGEDADRAFVFRRRWRDRVADSAGRALARQAMRKAKREAARFDDAPRLRVTGPWSAGPWSRKRPHGAQTLRAFIQINILPRPR